MSKLILNVAPVTSSPEAKVSVGIQPYDKTTLDSLRQTHQRNYLIKRGGEDGNSILAIARKLGLATLGITTDEQTLSQAPWLLAPLAMDALADFFVQLHRPILKWRPLRVVSQRPINLFPQDAGLPPWLQRRVVLDFETRIIQADNRSKSVILACGVRTSNAIDANCVEIMQVGIPIIGRYVATRRNADGLGIRPSLKLAGRIVELRGSQLILDDHGDGPETLEASEAFLEPRNENLSWCLQHLLKHNTESVQHAAANLAAEYLSGPKRLELVGKTFDYLRSQPIELAPGVPLILGALAGSSQQSLPFLSEEIRKPYLVFDPSGTRTDSWNERGIDKNGPYDQRTFAPKQLRIAVLCQAAYEGQVDAFVAKFLDGMPDIKTGTGKWIRAPYEKGFIRRYALETPKIQTFTIPGTSAQDYVRASRQAIEAATNGGFEWNLAIVQIDKDFRELQDAENPYFATKVQFLKQRVPVQEITLDTMRFSDQQLVFALNNMSVATYAKIGGVPWLLKSHPTVAHELVIGIGSHTYSTSRLGASERVVGITTVFSSDGKYLLDDRTGAVPYEEYKTALLGSLTRSIESVRSVDNWRSTDAVRLIFHVFKQMADREAEAVGELVESLGLTQVKFAFLHVVDDHPFTIFDEQQPGIRKRDGLKGTYAPERGVTVRISDGESLLCMTGSRDMKLANQGMPQPALLRLHRCSTFRDMTYLTRQAFDFSCHSWRMFTPAPQPISIHYSELIARLLTGLRHVPGWDPDTMLGPVSRTRWFL
ncbi:MAG: hypothetical protein PHD48_12060 [Alphaproteobacteria bacterium]|nr:hypothetical protein [Alphaproteobacteria bacterium]